MSSQYLLTKEKDTAAIDRVKFFLCFPIATVLIPLFSTLTYAQTYIQSDGSTNSLVNGGVESPCISGVCQISGGTRIGSSLFHSLSRFSLSSGDEAQFDNGDAVRIFTRITGEQSSTLDGVISATGSSADLFFLNPNGIVFGPNASLNIGGSFIASTADSIGFDNGAIFDATQTTFPDALLSINVPIGLQYGSNPGDITVQGSGSNVVPNPDGFGLDLSSRTAGLSVFPNQTLALIGGDVTFRGGNATAESGRIEIGAVGANGEVTLSLLSSEWQFDYGSVETLGTIRLAQSASLDVSGEGGGAMHLQGEDIILRGSSRLIANTLGGGTGQGLTLNASDRLLVGGASGLSSDVDVGATGRGGSLTIVTGDLKLLEGAFVSASTLGAGTAGGVDINAQQVEMAGTSRSAIFAGVGPIATGQGGNVRITTELMTLADGSQIITSAIGPGQGGDIIIDAQTIYGRGVSQVDFVGSAFSSVGFFGSGGDILINTESLTLDTGAFVSTETFGPGDAGNITVDAETITLDTGAFVSTGTFGPGDASNITIDAETITLDTGAFVSTGTFGPGDAGNITIDAETITLLGTPPDGLISDELVFQPSRLESSVAPDAVGNGGDITIQANDMLIEAGAGISSSSFGIGDTGEIDIRANRVRVTGPSSSPVGSALFDTSTIVSSLGPGSSGDGNPLSLRVNDLLLEDGGQIASTTFGSGDAGELIIDAQTITLAGATENFRTGIFAAAIADTGDGGDLTINADRLLVQDGASISVSNFQTQNSLPPGRGDAGSIILNIPIIQLDGEGLILADTNAGDKGKLTIQTDVLVLGDNSRISTNANSTDGGNIDIDAGAIAAFRNSDISANALVNGSGGRVFVSADGIFGTAFRPQRTSQSDITASSARGPQFDGEVVINTPDVDPSRGLVELPNTLVDVSDQVTTACAQIDEDTLVLAGAGGLPYSPNQTVQPNSIWYDLRFGQDSSHGDDTRFSGQPHDINSSNSALASPPSVSLKEAQSWWINEQGNFVLGHSGHDMRSEQRTCGRWN